MHLRASMATPQHQWNASLSALASKPSEWSPDAQDGCLSSSHHIHVSRQREGGKDSDRITDFLSNQHPSPTFLFLKKSILNNYLLGFSFKPFLLTGPWLQSDYFIALFLLIVCPVSSAWVAGLGKLGGKDPGLVLYSFLFQLLEGSFFVLFCFFNLEYISRWLFILNSQLVQNFIRL